MKNYDLIIIGSGPGGYVAAIKAAQENLSVALIENENIGGVCLNHGCIPTKAYIKSAKTYKDFKNAKNYGITVLENSVSINLQDIVNRKNRIVRQLTTGVAYLLKKNKVDVFNGYGTLISKDEVKVNDEILKAKNIIIATGASPIVPPIKGAKEAYESGFLVTSKELLKLTEQPKRLTIVGGGVIGIEFATIFNFFDSEVTILEMANDIANTMDEDIIREYTKVLRSSKVNIITNAKVTEIGTSSVLYEKDGNIETHETDLVLMAIGTKPNLDSFKDVDIKLNKYGVEVNEFMQTNIKGIYAIGDVTGKLMLAHVASKEGFVAVNHILGHIDKPINYNAIPKAIYGIPEIASVGLNEDEVKAKNISYTVSKVPLMANGKALADGQTLGFIKLIKGTENDEILGAHILAYNAVDILSEIIVGMNSNLTNADLADAVHPHPSLSEIIMEAALKKPIHI